MSSSPAAHLYGVSAQMLNFRLNVTGAQAERPPAVWATFDAAHITRNPSRSGGFSRSRRPDSNRGPLHYEVKTSKIRRRRCCGRADRPT
jgi:hypothetical protein